jgi:hypothetical protein
MSRIKKYTQVQCPNCKGYNVSVTGPLALWEKRKTEIGPVSAIDAWTPILLAAIIGGFLVCVYPYVPSLRFIIGVFVIATIIAALSHIPHSDGHGNWYRTKNEGVRTGYQYQFDCKNETCMYKWEENVS